MIKLSSRDGYKPKENCNGCGAGWTAKLVPDWIFWLKITDVCCIHDDRYEHGATIEDKQAGDREMRNNLHRKINATSWYYPKTIGKWIANQYYDKVDKYGGVAFWDGKKI